MPGNLTAVLTSWPLLLSLAARIGYDLYLKYAFPGLITGKLSDFAGIFLVTVLAFALLPRRRLLSTLLIVLLFAWWKSPLSQPVIDAINAIAPVRFARVVDYWDLLAFSMIPVALVVARRKSGETLSRYRRFAAFPVAVRLAVYREKGK